MYNFQYDINCNCRLCNKLDNVLFLNRRFAAREFNLHNRSICHENGACFLLKPALSLKDVDNAVCVGSWARIPFCRRTRYGLCNLDVLIGAPGTYI